MAGCHAHPFERATTACRACRHDFCPECVVHTYGPEKPPFCIPCALQAAGVRSTAGRRPAPSAGKAPRRFGLRRPSSNGRGEAGPVQCAEGVMREATA